MQATRPHLFMHPPRLALSPRSPKPRIPRQKCPGSVKFTQHAVIKHGNTINVHDRVEPVCHGNELTSSKLFADDPLHEVVCFVVDTVKQISIRNERDGGTTLQDVVSNLLASSLVKNNNPPPLSQNCRREAEELSLPMTQKLASNLSVKSGAITSRFECRPEMHLYQCVGRDHSSSTRGVDLGSRAPCREEQVILRDNIQPLAG